MKIFNSPNEYGLLAKLFHWITFIILIAQVPFGFYLVGLEFSPVSVSIRAFPFRAVSSVGRAVGF